MSETAIFSILTVLGYVASIILIFARTEEKKADVITNSAQADVDLRSVSIEREKLVNQMATQLLATQGYIIELVSDKAKAVEREKNYLTHIASLDTELVEVKKTLNLAYGEVTRLNEQIEKLLTSILSDSKPETVAVAKEVAGDTGAPPATPPIVTQAAVDQVAAAQTPTAPPEAAKEEVKL